LWQVVAAATDGAGQRCCPCCGETLPAVLPNVNERMKNTVQLRHPEQVHRSSAPHHPNPNPNPVLPAVNERMRGAAAPPGAGTPDRGNKWIGK
jgi:hypothetical protein